MADVIEDKPVTTKPEKFGDDTDLLNDLLVEKEGEENGEEETEETEDDETTDEEEILDDKIKEDEEEELVTDEVTNSRNIDLKRIKEKYPDFAKTNDFRELRNAYHREAAFSELFPTLDDAREAAENNVTFNKLNDALVNRGDVTVLLNAVKSASPEAAKRIASNFLDAVGKFDSQLYLEAVSPVIKKVAKQIYIEGQKYLKRNRESEDGLALVATARNIMQYAFEDPDLVDKEDAPQNNQLSQKEQELNQRELGLRQERWMGAYKIAENSVEKHLDRQILANINTNNEFLRDSLLEKIKNEVKAQIGKDSLHLRKMDSLWKRAEQSGYSRESLSSIVSAYLERARPIIPVVRNKYKSIALRGKSDSNGREQNEEKELKIPSSGKSGRAPQRDGKINLRGVDTKKIDYSKTSDDDIFEGKVKLKG